MKSKYQTISEFMRSPFNRGDSFEKNTKYEENYRKYIQSNKIRVEGYSEIEDSYYIHIKVPSETHSEERYAYDVIIRFFTTNPLLKSESSLRAYYIQFFSNSPGFIYNYATLYKQEGYLIEILYDKMDPEFKDKLPEKTNADMKLSYDKTIYFACKFLSENKFHLLHKRGILLQKKKSPDKFISDISDFKSAKLDQDLLNTERSLKKELDKTRQKEAQNNHNKSKRLLDSHRKTAGKSTAKKGTVSSITYAVKKTGASRITKKKVASKSVGKRK